MAEMRKYFFLESDPKHTRFGGPLRVRLWIYEELHNKVKKGKIVPQLSISIYLVVAVVVFLKLHFLRFQSTGTLDSCKKNLLSTAEKIE